MRELETIGRKAMSRLLEGLRRWPSDYDSHPFAAGEFVGALIADIKVPVSPPLRPEGRGGWPLLQAIALLVLDSIYRLLHESRRDKSLTSDERLNSLEQLLVGFIVVWFKDIQPALKEPGSPDRSVTYGEAINAGESPLSLGRLVEKAHQDAKRYSRYLKWIPNVFTQLHKQGETGHRKAGYYRDKALGFLAQRIIQTGHSLTLDTGDLLRELAGAGYVPQAAEIAQAPDVAQTPELKPDTVLDWTTRLSQCVADYRAYELQEIERLLREQGLASSFDWFLPRQVYCPVNQAEVGEEIATLNLADICKPGLRTALLDHRGSGATTALLWLSSQWCSNTADVEPVVLRLDAEDYKKYAAAQSPLEYLARKVYGTGRDSRADRVEFKEILGETEIICLIDNLARVLPDDQLRIGRQLGIASGLVITASTWVSDEELSEIGGEGTVRVELLPLGKAQIQQFIAEFAERSGPDFGALLAQHIAGRELPETARLPLGLRIICESVQAQDSNCASVMQAFVSELFQRDESPLPEWDRSLSKLPGVILALMRLAMELYWARYAMVDTASLQIGEEGAKRCLENWQMGDQWSAAVDSLLLVRTDRKTYQFLNHEVLGFLVAIGSVRREVNECNWRSISCVLGADIEGVANRHYLALLEQAAVG